MLFVISYIIYMVDYSTYSVGMWQGTRRSLADGGVQLAQYTQYLSGERGRRLRSPEAKTD